MTATGARLLAWVRRRIVLLLATAATITFVALVGVVTLRVAEERQARTEQIGNLSRANCEGINGSNETVRFILDGALRGRSVDAPPIPDNTRRLYVETYRRLPSTDCTTGARTYFDPPFPS